MLKILNRQSKFNNNSKTYCDDNRMFSFSCSKSGKTWGQDYYYTYSRGRFRF